MPQDLFALVTFGLSEGGVVQGYMQHAYYSVLFSFLALASLGLPIPEDLPLIAAGVLLRTHPGIANWPMTMVVALGGIMVGDLILYRLGHTWGPGVVNHRLVRRVITPRRFRKASEKFHRHGTWFCFFGRFFMGIRAAMCVTAGATRFPYWRFFLADFAGAALSVPFFMYLGYWFAGVIPTLRAYTTVVQVALTVGVLLTVAGIAFVKVRRRRARRAVLAAARRERSLARQEGQPMVDVQPTPGEGAAHDPPKEGGDVTAPAVVPTHAACGASDPEPPE